MYHDNYEIFVLYDDFADCYYGEIIDYPGLDFTGYAATFEDAEQLTRDTIDQQIEIDAKK